MFHSLKVFLLAILATTLLAPPVLAGDKIESSESISKETLTQIGKDLAGLYLAVEKATKELSTPARDVRIVCDDPTSPATVAAAVAERDRLIEEGYVITKDFTRDITFVGTGLILTQSKTGVLIAETLYGSSARATEFFHKEDRFHIKAVNGIPVFERNLDDVRAMIRGNTTPGTGVVITVAREKGGRDFDRFLTRTRMKLKDASYCERLEAPLKK